MSEPFVAEIRICAFNFPPSGWAFCDGQLLSLAQNTALFSLLGTTYGGDGQTTFGLPDLRGRMPLHPGQGPGLSLYDLGQEGGSETVTLLATQIPNHTHVVRATSAGGTSADPAAKVWATPGATRGLRGYNLAPGTGGAMAAAAISTVGGQPHNNLQPYLTVNLVIALQGVYPPRS